MKTRSIFTGAFLLLILISVSDIKAQTYYYFQDSPNDEYLDASWMVVTAPSELERKGNDLRKFPVETAIPARQGFNSLRLKWKSVSGGDWHAIAAGLGWTDYDISDTDTLLFYLRSEILFNEANLPKVFMEDVTNKKSDYHLISDWTEDLQAGEWTAVKIPMRIFFEANDGTDFTRIKTIGFAQNATDGVEHTLYIDDMRVYKGNGSFPAAEIPAGVSATGYDSHIDITWDFNPETDLQGYRVERTMDAGVSFSIIDIIDPDENHCIDFTGDLGTEVSAGYRVLAINASNDPSEPSDTVYAETSVFSDEELLDMVQEYTFRYFWDHAHESCGASLERNTSSNTVASGGTGFGLMSIIVGIERGFITREEGAARTLQILEFLESADRFHGAWSHWINGNTGAAKPFSEKDNGGDIVETSYVAQALLTLRQYFTESNATETDIVQTATDLWEAIEWDWYRKDGSSAIYWHWSPDYHWDMNMIVRGWNEAAIVYLLAIASTTHGVPASLWETGWAGGNYDNPRSLFDHDLYLGVGFGGPLFFAHYSFVGFDPNNLRDDYANYFTQNRNHSLVQQAYCEQNSKGWEGYSTECWGITASDDPDGYMAHAPGNNDNGTITPTAALSSFPYTPDESMLALKHFYRNLGDKIWDWMGFKDAFNETRDWYADSYLAIDQGPIILMIENYRSQLLWDLFMANPEIQPMLDAIGFRYSPNSTSHLIADEDLRLYPNPANDHTVLQIQLHKASVVSLKIINISGKVVQQITRNEFLNDGTSTFNIFTGDMPPGIYFLSIESEDIAEKSLKLLVF